MNNIFSNKLLITLLLKIIAYNIEGVLIYICSLEFLKIFSKIFSSYSKILL